jgi:hypothetical protein
MKNQGSAGITDRSVFLWDLSDTIDVVDYYVLPKDFKESIGLRDYLGEDSDFLRKSNINEAVL